MTDVAIVGGGILGTATAFALARAGLARPLVIERDRLSSGATGRSGAIVRSSYPDRAQARLAAESLICFQQWGERVGGDCGFRRCGVLEIHDSAERLDRVAHPREEWGLVPIRRVRAGAALPTLRGASAEAAAGFEAEGGYCDPVRTNAALAAAARRHGAEFAENETVIAIRTQGQRVVELVTSRRRIAAARFLVAAGVATSALMATAGIAITLRRRVSRVAVFGHDPQPHETGRPVLIDHAAAAWFRPVDADATLVGCDRGGAWLDSPARPDPSIPPDVSGLYRDLLTERLGWNVASAPRRTWSGTYCCSADGLLAIGRVPPFDNLYVATADNGGAFKLGPATGEVLGRWIDGREATVSPDFETLAAARLCTDLELAA